MKEKSKQNQCDIHGHDFLVKRQQTEVSLNGVPREQNVSELFCRRCGTVCFLNSPPPISDEEIRTSYSGAKQ